MSCHLCPFRTVPASTQVVLQAGDGEFFIDPKAIGDDNQFAAGGFPGRIFGSGHAVKSIHVADSSGQMKMSTTTATWATWANVPQFPQFMDIHFFEFQKFRVEMTGFGMVPATKTINFLLEIDTLEPGATCACGRKNEQRT